MSRDPYDVVVVGAGNAGLCAALSAKEHGARVLILEAHGGGQGLSDRLFEIAEGSDIDIAYETKATGLETDDRNAITGVRAFGPGGKRTIRCSAVVLAAGGFGTFDLG